VKRALLIRGNSANPGVPRVSDRTATGVLRATARWLAFQKRPKLALQLIVEIGRKRERGSAVHTVTTNLRIEQLRFKTEEGSSEIRTLPKTCTPSEWPITQASRLPSTNSKKRPQLRFYGSISPTPLKPLSRTNNGLPDVSLDLLDQADRSSAPNSGFKFSLQHPGASSPPRVPHQHHRAHLELAPSLWWMDARPGTNSTVSNRTAALVLTGLALLQERSAESHCLCRAATDYTPPIQHSPVGWEHRNIAPVFPCREALRGRGPDILGDRDRLANTCQLTEPRPWSKLSQKGWLTPEEQGSCHRAENEVGSQKFPDPSLRGCVLCLEQRVPTLGQTGRPLLNVGATGVPTVRERKHISTRSSHL
jgi:hypothetical protein